MGDHLLFTLMNRHLTRFRKSCVELKSKSTAQQILNSAASRFHDMSSSKQPATSSFPQMTILAVLTTRPAQASSNSKTTRHSASSRNLATSRAARIPSTRPAPRQPCTRWPTMPQIRALSSRAPVVEMRPLDMVVH
jgi:hypothetical protein